MTITLKIENADTEKKLKQFIKNRQEVSVDALRSFLNSFQTEKPLSFKKKDPKNHSHTIEYSDDSHDDLSDVMPYTHIKDSAAYIHELRRKSRS